MEPVPGPDLLALCCTSKGLTGDWGMAIILLTVAIRLILTAAHLEADQVHGRAAADPAEDQGAAGEVQGRQREAAGRDTQVLLRRTRSIRSAVACPLLLQMPIFFALYGVLGARQPKLGSCCTYLTEHREIGTFYQIIPDVAKTPQMVWNTHNYLMAASPTFSSSCCSASACGCPRL